MPVLSASQAFLFYPPVTQHSAWHRGIYFLGGCFIVLAHIMDRWSAIYSEWVIGLFCVHVPQIGC
jgi:hypothetical protein